MVLHEGWVGGANSDIWAGVCREGAVGVCVTWRENLHVGRLTQRSVGFIRTGQSSCIHNSRLANAGT